MKLLKILLAFVGVLLVQTMVLDKYEWVRLIDLFLLLNIYFALNFNQMASMAVSVPSGLIQDAFSKGIIGLNAFSKTIIAFLISGLSSRLMIKHPLIIMMLIAISVLLDYLVLYGLHGLFHLPPFPMTPTIIAVACLLNSVVGIISFQFTDRIRSRKEYV